MLDLRYQSVEEAMRTLDVNSPATEVFCNRCVWEGRLEAEQDPFEVFAPHFLHEHEKDSYRSEV